MSISKKFKKSLIIDIDNAYLRPINIHDISQLYIDGLNDSEVHQFLVAAKKKKQDYKSISKYVNKNWESKDAILFGFFLDNILRGTVRLHDIIDKKSVEGFGISFMEAASYSVGSIGGKDGGESDAILHNKTGLICDGTDLNSIYNSVKTILHNEQFIKFGKEAKNFSENFYWNKVVKKYLNLIN